MDTNNGTDVKEEPRTKGGPGPGGQRSSPSCPGPSDHEATERGPRGEDFTGVLPLQGLSFVFANLREHRLRTGAWVSCRDLRPRPNWCLESQCRLPGSCVLPAQDTSSSGDTFSQAEHN